MMRAPEEAVVRWIVVAALVGCAQVEGPADQDSDPPVPPDPAARGPWEVGIATFTFDVAGYTDVAAEVWYPSRVAAAEPGRYDFVGFPFVAEGYRGVPPDADAPNLVVAFSHGFGGARQQNYTMAEHLASHGFVVVAPDHPGTTTLDYLAGLGDVGADLVRRPVTVSAAVDALAAGAVDGLAPDVDRFAMVGQSLGAWTALAVGGGVLSSAAYRAACDGDPEPSGCAILGDVTYTEEDVAAYGRPDPRVVTTVLQTPGGFYSYDEASLADVAHPLVMGATLDQTLPFEAEAVGTWERLGTPAAFATFERAGHYGFTNMCDLGIALVFADDCAGEAAGFRDPLQVRAQSITYVTAWLGTVFGGWDGYADALGAGEGVGWQAR